jgi:hypothetical protein
MGKNLQPKAHIAKLNELPVSEVTKLTSSMVHETALANLNRQGSRGIQMVICKRNSNIVFMFELSLLN